MNERNQIYKKKINLKFEKVRDDVLENSIYDLQNDFNIKPNFDVYYYKVENTEHYEFDIEYRGYNYAYKASKLVLQVAKAHNMSELILTCDESNIASYKTIEKLGAELIEIVKPPKDYFAYREDMEKQRIYKLSL